MLDKENSNKKWKLTLHHNEISMRHKQFDIAVEENKGKILSTTY